MRDYSAQATPQVIAAAGWDFILQVTDYARKDFTDSDFYPLIKNPDGSSTPNSPDGRVKVIFIEFPKRPMIAYPYLDADGGKMVYVQFENEDHVDSVSIPDGQNRTK